MFLILAMYLIGRKWRHAFLLTIIGEALWFVVGVQMGRTDIAFLPIIFILIAGWNWIKWGK